MTYSNLKEEKKLWKKGYAIVAGIDEAGRGPLAGPVVACAVCLCGRINLSHIKLKDSKQYNAKQREELYAFLTSRSDMRRGIGIVSEKVIDQINILQATKLAMKKAIKSLQQKTAIDFLIIDGNIILRGLAPCKAVVKGDEKVFSCAAASIIAKVTRDRIMQKYHTQYPEYGFDKHKGYGTKHHMEMIKKYGPCPIHRKTFAPVQTMHS